MSSVYVNEPPTAGKVVLHTTFGDVDVELFSREAPLACRNFVQLCLERAYDDTLFHRVIPGFMVQTGDPTGTGTGGQSIWGKAFKDEFHSRLKFSHRGRVAMANSNTPNSNRQQFFITLDKATHCDSKYTIFGKVAGPTIFNVLRIGEVETDERDKPLEPVRIEGVDVIWNPFDDVVPRSSMEKLSAAEKAEQEEEKRRKERRKRRRKVKDNKLLSFGDEEAQERPSGAKGQSGGVKAQSDGAKEQAGGAREQAETSEAAAVERADKDQEAPARSMAPAPGSRPVPDEPERPTLALGEEQEEKQSAANAELEEARAEFRRLENKFLAKAVAPPSTKPGDRKKAEAAEKTIRPTLTLASSAGARSESERSKDVLLTEVEKRRRRYTERKTLGLEDREEETLRRLDKFRAQMRDTKAKQGKRARDRGVYSRESYRGQVLEDDDEDDDDADNSDWFVGKLKFRKHIDDRFRSGQSADDDLVVVDDRRDAHRSSKKDYRRGRR